MRQGNKPQLIVNNDVVIGVNLGADFCAEHEWEISSLKQAFGISDNISVYGLKRRQISITPSKNLQWFDFSSIAGFVYHAYCYQGGWKKLSDVSRELSEYHDSLRGAWSEQDFAVVSSNEAEVKALKEIFSQFARLNIVFTFGGARLSVFDNPGLVIAIADRLPKDVIEMWEKGDRERHEIRQEVDALGIEQLLKDRGKRYYALSPKRKLDGSLHFWLNPQDQHKNNCGWFTVEDLREWAESKGHIPMKANK